MAWNEPDNDDRKQDPWGSGPRGGKDQGPPDIDELLSSLGKKFSRFFGGGRGGGFGGGGDGKLSNGLLAGVVVIGGIIWVAAGFYTVDETERGVVLRFGQAQEAVVQPGLHWNPPLIDQVTKINVTRVNDQAISGDMLTEDDNIVNLSMTVQYIISDPRDYYLEVRDPDLSLREAAESAVRHVVGSSTMDTALTVGRQQMALDVQERLQQYLDSYGTGITVSQVNIDRSQPPDDVREAFDDVIKAREDNRSFQNEARAYANQVVPEARGRARRVREEAEAYKEQVTARAEGDASRFEQLLAEYKKSPDVLRRRLYLETMESVMANSSKVLVDVEGGGNNMIYLPLDRMMQQGRQLSSDGSSSGNDGPLNEQELRQLSDQVIRNIQSRQGTSTTTRGGGR